MHRSVPTKQGIHAYAKKHAAVDENKHIVNHLLSNILDSCRADYQHKISRKRTHTIKYRLKPSCGYEHTIEGWKCHFYPR
jgi:hypothetical protein